MDDRVELFPIGGLGEVGMNCLALATARDAILVDCGLTFPDRRDGTDVIRPDLTWVRHHADRVRAVFLTHAHDDHVGAVPWLLDRVQIPVLGPRYALTVLRARLAEHGIDDAELVELEAGRALRYGDFEVSAVRVAHSTADCVALGIDTPAGLIVHSGDFLVESGEDHGGFDVDGFRALGDRGVRLLLSDSTNVDVASRTVDEHDVGETLETLARSAPHRVVVSCFASNVQRVARIIDVARATGRKIAVLGRSAHMHLESARATGYVRDPSDVLISAEEAATMPRRKVLLLATGSQAEPHAALTRLAEKRHPLLALEEGDTVLLSSRVIPGNERDVQRLIDSLERAGAVVRTRTTDPTIHATGHASRAEQTQLIELVRPRGFVPVHGTYHHLSRHAALARELGVGEVLIVENGTSVKLDRERLSRGEPFQVGRIHVENGRDVEAEVLRERSVLGQVGVAHAVIHRNGRAPSVQVTLTGVVGPRELAALERDAENATREALGSEGRHESTAERARRALRRHLQRVLGRIPHVVVSDLTAHRHSPPRGDAP